MCLLSQVMDQFEHRYTQGSLYKEIVSGLNLAHIPKGVLLHIFMIVIIIFVILCPGKMLVGGAKTTAH